ncbi:MAG: WD40 repeat domain-containing protein [Anaerolineales bacterium]|nr:WD40 repeat domain-containing protein [Anaerolineales bacterium]
MSRVRDLQSLIAKHTRSLQKLKEQQALFGIHTPHHLLIEIEDIEAEIEKLQVELANLEGGKSASDSLDNVPVQPVWRGLYAAKGKTKFIWLAVFLLTIAAISVVYSFYPAINPAQISPSPPASPDLPPPGDLLMTTISLADVISDIGFTPDGQFLFAASANQNQIRVVRVADGKAEESFPEPGVIAMAFSPDGQILATADWGPEIKLWHVADRKPFHQLNTTNSPSSVAFAPADAQVLAIGLWDGTIQLWRIDQTEPYRILRGHTDGVTSIAFAPDGQTLASGSKDTTARLWRLTEDQPLYTLREHHDRVASVAFSGDGQILATGSWDNTVKLWRMSDHTLIQTFDSLTGPVTSMALTPDGQVVAAGLEDGSVKIWRVGGSAIPQILTGHVGVVERLKFSADGQTLVSGSGDGTVKLWRVER